MTSKPMWQLLALGVLPSACPKTLAAKSVTSLSAYVDLFWLKHAANVWRMADNHCQSWHDTFSRGMQENIYAHTNMSHANPKQVLHSEAETCTESTDIAGLTNRFQQVETHRDCDFAPCEVPSHLHRFVPRVNGSDFGA